MAIWWTTSSSPFWTKCAIVLTRLKRSKETSHGKGCKPARTRSLWAVSSLTTNSKLVGRGRRRNKDRVRPQRHYAQTTCTKEQFNARRQTRILHCYACENTTRNHGSKEGRGSIGAIRLAHVMASLVSQEVPKI